MLRDNDLTESMSSFTHQYFEKNITEVQSRNLVLTQFLPVKGNLDPNANTVFNKFIESIGEMTFAIGVDRSESIFTSDNPLYFSSPDRSLEKLAEIKYPLTPDLAIFRYNRQIGTECRRNYLFDLNEEKLAELNDSIAFAAKMMIFSKHPLSAKNQTLIKNAREKRREYCIDHRDFQGGKYT